MSVKKPRSDSKLKAGLDLEQQDTLRDWLIEGLPYKTIQALCKAEFGVSTSLAALSDFFGSVVGPYLLERRSRSALLAKQVTDAAEKDGENFSEATLKLLRQQAFELMADSKRDPKEVARMLGLFLKSQDQDLNRRKVDLLEQKAAMLEEVQGVVSGKASDEDKQATLKAMFGMGG